MQTKYLIIGGSHAGLSALEAIRRFDGDASLTMVTKEKRRPYSPTALPYVISGKISPEKTDIRPPDYFSDLDFRYLDGLAAIDVDTNGRRVKLDNGLVIEYERLLIATGARAFVPQITGIETVDYLTIRTMSDAETIRQRMSQSQSALIIGAGFIGMHAAENLANAGLQVSVVEALDQIMPSSFDKEAASLIRTVFAEKGIDIRTGRQVSKVFKTDKQIHLVLEDGNEIAGDILIVAAGIRPNTDFLANSSITCDPGVVVDARMRATAPHVWAAGDVASAGGFFPGKHYIGGTIPCATEQARTAGMDMAQDSYAADYRGNLNMNAFGFFGNFAFSIGNVAETSAGPACEIYCATHHDSGKKRFQKFIFDGPYLTGVSAINMQLDPGILKEMILRRTDLSKRKETFIKMPLETGRQIIRELS